MIFNHQHRCLLSPKPEGKCWFAEEDVGRVLWLLHLCTGHGCHYQPVANLAPSFGVPQVQQERCDLTRKILFSIKHILAIGNAAPSLERVISSMWSCFLRALKRSYRTAQTGSSLKSGKRCLCSHRYTFTTELIFKDITSHFNTETFCVILILFLSLLIYLIYSPKNAGNYSSQKQTNNSKEI